MLKAKKIRLKPTPEQEVLFWKSAGTSRWAYNYFLSENERIYREYLDNGKVGVKYIGGGDIRKYINNTLKKTTHKWLAEVRSNVMKQAVKDAEKAYKDWLSGKRGKPRYKSKRKSKISFYVNYESLTRKDGGFHGEKYSDPHISYDGKYWYLSVGYPAEKKAVELSGDSLGIDLGIKALAVCSNGKVYKNINKSARVKKLNKRLKREQRKLSRMIENNLHQTTSEIVKTKPSRIVMETLNVRGMMKNRHLSTAIAEQGFFEFKRQIAYKSEFHGIELVEVPMYYPSSKTCSCCGAIKKDLKLSERVYRCEHCGRELDRDFNASINLANYQSA